ncbi:AMP-binding protein [Planomonospora sp. ID67723]|uniref:AMP-binding protein n=1 Tax=Planomonospora sp. ID67723 TaxID=2738134 RepID=UPI0018C35CF2|nr:AMP-binding protein [Planomonospora sp. ID67723]MBG0832059.1 AMP-binding protein [Planomonospora sp. ID67723]
MIAPVHAESPCGSSSGGLRGLNAVTLPPGPGLFRAIAAALDGTGPAVLPLSPGLPGPALRATLEALRPTHLDGARQAGGRGVSPEVAVVIATSGTTGVPKGVELSAAALRASAAASLDRLGARPGERWLCCLPPSHVSGLQVLVRSLLGGTDPIIHEGFSPEAVLASGAEHVSLVPTQLRRLLAVSADLSAFRTILLGGAAAPADLLAAARGAGGRVVTTYGMSETCGGCVYDGRPLDKVELELGGDGRIRIAGPVLFSGYRLRPDLTAGAREGRWFVTSDLGALDDGRLRVLGRADDVINTGGEKVVAAAVAAVVAEHPAITDAVVVGRPDPEWGERVVAVVVSPRPPSLAELRAFVKERLPAYAAPAELVVLTEIPLLPNGKPDLSTLRYGRKGEPGGHPRTS